jgi:hypothetical protein
MITKAILKQPITPSPVKGGNPGGFSQAGGLKDNILMKSLTDKFNSMIKDKDELEAKFTK